MWPFGGRLEIAITTVFRYGDRPHDDPTAGANSPAGAKRPPGGLVHDPLTGLLDRLTVLEQLTNDPTRGDDMAIVIVDID